MTDELFRSGTLQLPSTPQMFQTAAVPWSDNGINGILVIVAVLLFLLSLRDFLQVLPYVSNSLRWFRNCIHLEHNYSMARLRNELTLVTMLPFCLIADRFGFLQHLFGWQFPPRTGVLLVFAVLFSFALLRRLMHLLFCPGRMDHDRSRALLRTVYSFFIVLTLLMMASTAICLQCKLSQDVCCRILFIEIICFYLWSLLRSVQILASACSGLSTILYLCALEFVPAAAMALACTYLKL